MPEPERAPPRPVAPDAGLAARGRRLFAALFATLVGFELLLLGLQVHFGSLVAMRTGGRLVLELFLLYAIWRGHRWAAYVLGACFTLVAVAALGVLAFDVWAWSADILIGAWGSILGAWAVVLFRSRALVAYQHHQRT